MFVSGPVGISVTGPARPRASPAGSASAPSGRTSERGSGRSAPSSPLSPWTSSAISSGRSSGAAAPAATGHVRPAEQREHAQRVAGRLAQADVAGHGRDAQHVELRAGERERDRERVVVARVAVEQDRDARGYGRLPNASMSSVANRARSMTMPTSALGARPSRRSRYGWPSQTVRPRAGPSVVSSDDVVRRDVDEVRDREVGDRHGVVDGGHRRAATTACCGRARSR